MEKKLIINLSICLLSLILVSKVKAEDIKYERIINQQYANGIPGVTIKPFKVGDTSIKLEIPQNWYVHLYRGTKGTEHVEIEYQCYKYDYKEYHESTNTNRSKISLFDGYISPFGGLYEIQLKKPFTSEEKQKIQTSYDNPQSCPVPIQRENKPLEKGERVIFVVRNEYNLEEGIIIYEDSEKISEEEKATTFQNNQNTTHEQYENKNHSTKETHQKDIILEGPKKDEINEQKLLNMFKEEQKSWKQRFKDNVKGHWYNFKGWLYGTAY
ncbi:TPA: hypothetical protein TVL50_000783 [Streptococcus equi subsp. zooepidemicus]|nr:hypothetical protein [Streptococcus equi subsp. zooepidemicus]